MSFESIALSEVEPESYRTIIEAWSKQRGDLPFPPAEKIDPFVVPALAPNVILLEVQDGTLIYRILGEKVITALKTSPKGRTITEAFGDTPYMRLIRSQLLECAASGMPLYSCHDFHLPENGQGLTGQTRKAWRIALPYGEPDRVSRLLCYQLFSDDIEVTWLQGTDFNQLLPKTVFKVQV